MSLLVFRDEFLPCELMVVNQVNWSDGRDTRGAVSLSVDDTLEMTAAVFYLYWVSGVCTTVVALTFFRSI